MVENNSNTGFWLPIIKSYQIRNSLIKAALEALFEKTNSQGVKHLFVSENFAALLKSGNNIGLFASGDVDLVADTKEMTLIKGVLDDLGYEYTDISANGSLLITHCRNDRQLPFGFVLNINWTLFPRKYLPPIITTSQAVDYEKLECLGGSIKIPDLTSLLYVCLLHTSLHSFCRKPGIRLYVDIANLQRKCTEEVWQEVLARASKDGVYRRVVTAISVSKRLGVDGIPGGLSPSGSSVLVALVCKKNGLRLNMSSSVVFSCLVEMLCDDKGCVHFLSELMSNTLFKRKTI